MEKLNAPEVVLLVTGALVWLLIGLFALVYAAVMLRYFGEWLCFVGYSAFADRAEKQAIRERARELADRPTKPRDAKS